MIKIEKDKFLRTFKFQNQEDFNIFLGAGASVSSNIPTGRELVLYFKREILISQKKLDAKKYTDLNIEATKTEIEKYFDDSQISNPYSHYFNEFLEHSDERHNYLTKLIKDKKPSVGFLCLAALISEKIVTKVWTTNFDDLIEKGLYSIGSQSHIVISPDNAGSINNFQENMPTVIKLHGDFRYDSLQNTDDELQKLDNNLHNYFIELNNKKGLLVIGYSGSDNSVMASINKVLENENPFPKGLVWCIPKGSSPNPKLIALIKKANLKNNKSGFLEIDNFDFFMYELYKMNEIDNKVINELTEKAFEEKSIFRLNQPTSKATTIMLNSIKATEIPKVAYVTKVNFQGEGQWKKLREIIENKDIVGAFHKQNLYLFGNESEIHTTFAKYMIEKMEIKNIEDKFFYYSDSFYLGMLYELIEKSLVSSYGLKLYKKGRNLRKFYTDTNNDIYKEIEKIYYKYRPNIPKNVEIYNAFEFKLEFIDKHLFFFIIPTIYVHHKNNNTLNKDEEKNISNKILSNRYNNKYGTIMNGWLKFLEQKDSSLNFKIADFKIVMENYFSTAVKAGKNGIHYFPNYLKLSEPYIYFHHSDTTKKTTNPLDGLKNLHPLGESYNGVNPMINLAILSPHNDFKKIQNHLYGLLDAIEIKSERDYLVGYSGFDSIYKRQLIIPNDIQNEYVITINDNDVQNKDILEFYTILKNKIDIFANKSTEIDCLIVYIPKYWKKFRELKNEQTYFDLHDSLKIYAVKRGLKLQFIEDKSLSYFDQAKVRWWLSLGIYTKSNGIPWKIETDDRQSAFIGLSYAIKKYSDRSRTVLSSSQMFDGNGNGLKFLLQPMENPVTIQNNPFMSKEDAFKLVNNIRNTYHKIDPTIGLKKVVIHKTTMFTKDEIIGISTALEGIDNIELLQIQQFTNWRALKLIKNIKNRHDFDKYPIERGTIILIDDYTFLLWTHGLVYNGQRKYYQGSRSIPTPLLVRRFKGKDSLERVANDIIKLTKMNWNGAELYKTLPITIDFSKRLSVMSKQLEELDNKAYDFKYFM